MRKAKILLAGLLAIALLGSTTVLYASDISGAIWQGILVVSNTTNTTETNISVNMSLSSSALVNGGFTNSTLTDVGIQINGTDTAFMPGWSTNSWIVFAPVSPVGNINYEFYSGNVSGGKLRYFPDDNGMSVADHSSLELGNNFTIEQSGWIDTTPNSNKNLVYKEAAFQTYISGTEEITSDILQLTSLTWAVVHSSNSAEGSYVEQTFSQRYISQIRLRAYNADGGSSAEGRLHSFQVWNDNTDAWVNPGSASGWTNSSNAIDGSTGTYAEYLAPLSDWTAYLTATMTTPVLSTKARWYFTDPSARFTTKEVGVYWNVTSVGATVTALGVSSGEHEVKTVADSTNLTLYIDDIPKATIALSGASVPNNANAWYFGQNGAIPYMEYAEVTVGGSQAGYWSWEYGATFDDQSVNSNTATPTFRTDSSVAGITASLSTLIPVIQAQLSIFSLGEITDLLTELPDEPTGMYTDLETSRVPGGEAIDEVLTASGLSGNARALWWFPFIYIAISIIGLLVYGATTLAVREGRIANETIHEGSLMITFVVMELLIALAGIINPVPFWPALLFPIPAVAIIISRKHYSWG